MDNEEILLTENEEETEEKQVKSKKKTWLLIETIVLTVVLVFFDASFWTVALLWLLSLVFYVIDRLQKSGIKTILHLVSYALIIALGFSVYNLYLDNKYVNIVKKAEYYSVPYEELFNDFSVYVEWECTNNEKFTAINYNKSEKYNGGFIGEVKISGGCYLNDIETDYVLTCYISEYDKSVVPTSLYIGEENYSDEINSFFQTLYDTHAESYQYE